MNSPFESDVFIIGGGPAGSAAAIWLAKGDLRVVLVEQNEFPRQKVCGECIPAGALSALDELGVGADIRSIDGPEIRQVAWMGSTTTVVAPFPRCTMGSHAYGRAIGRDKLDSVLITKARSVGVRVVQPAKVRSVAGTAGHFLCNVEERSESTGARNRRSPRTQTWAARVVIDAHGSWEPAPGLAEHGGVHEADQAMAKDSDLFAFKASFTHSALQNGLLPVIAFPGGYGGIVVSNDGRTTLACCIRRDALPEMRAGAPGERAGSAVAAMLRRSCPGIAEALSSARQESTWLSVGPIRPGIRVDRGTAIIRIGNAAGEAHPLIGEGINMALESAKLAATQISRLEPAAVNASTLYAMNRAYAIEWRAAFEGRLRFASVYAHAAMRPSVANPLGWLLQARPSLMTYAARWAGKAKGPSV